MMAKQPESMVEVMLQGIQRDIRDLGRILDRHTLQHDFLSERVEDLRESTMTGLGFATNANLHAKKVEKQLVELTKRVEQLEKAK